MDFEFEAVLRDGRRVFIVGEAEYSHSCDCNYCDGTHILSLDIESVTQLFEAGTVEGAEIKLGGKAWREVESLAEDRVYSAIETGEEACA